MPWAKLDDGAHSHPKIVRAGNEAIGAWARMISYCGCYLTDGAVARSVAVSFCGGEQVLKHLLSTRLVDHVDANTVAVHDYLDYNPSAAEVHANQAKKAAAGRKGGKARAQAPAQAPAQASVKQYPDPSRPAPIPTRPDPDPPPPPPSGERGQDLFAAPRPNRDRQTCHLCGGWVDRGAGWLDGYDAGAKRWAVRHAPGGCAPRPPRDVGDLPCAAGNLYGGPEGHTLDSGGGWVDDAIGRVCARCDRAKRAREAAGATDQGGATP